MSKSPVNFMEGFRSLAERDGVRRQQSSPATPAETTPGPQPPADPVLRSESKGTRQSQQRNRIGRVAITQWVDPTVRKQLAQLALDEDTSQAALVAEALNLLFEKYGRLPIATP